MMNTGYIGLFSWNIDTGGIPRFLHRSWQIWARFRFRRSDDKEGRNFLSAGLYLNAPQQADKRYFTGVLLGLFLRTLRLGYWRPLSHYHLAEDD